ncbi:MAG: hypothetical protein ACI4TZ_03915 [Christensenellales bacterium]
MEDNKKAVIKSAIFKQALKNFERSYLNFLDEPTLENYIETKTAQSSFLECRNNCLNKKQQELVDVSLKDRYRCFSFKEISQFEEILKIRSEREALAIQIANSLIKYEQNAKKMGKKPKADYFTIFIDFIDNLNAIELQTKVNTPFPKASYIKLPVPSKLKLSQLRKLADDEHEATSEKDI